jgi:hypothetical protein
LYKTEEYNFNWTSSAPDKYLRDYDGEDRAKHFDAITIVELESDDVQENVRGPKHPILHRR